MAEFQIKGEFSGRTYTFDAPSEDLTPEQVAYAQSVIRQREQEFADYYTSVTGREADLRPGTALGRGILDLGPTSAYGALGTAARGIGEQTGIAALSRLGSGMEQSAMREQLAEAGRFAAAPRLADAEGVGETLTAIGEGIGQSIPEMGATIGATLAGGALGTALGGPVLGAGLGAYGAGAAAATPFFLGRNLQRQEAQLAAGELDEVDFGRALGTAAGQSALNVVGEKILLAGRLFGIGLPTAQRLTARIARRGAAGAVAEANTEVLQQAMERAQAEMPAGLDDPDARAEYFEAAVLGAVMGGGLAGGIGAFQAPRPATTDPRTGDRDDEGGAGATGEGGTGGTDEGGTGTAGTAGAGPTPESEDTGPAQVSSGASRAPTPSFPPTQEDVDAFPVRDERTVETLEGVASEWGVSPRVAARVQRLVNATPGGNTPAEIQATARQLGLSQADVAGIARDLRDGVATEGDSDPAAEARISALIGLSEAGTANIADQMIALGIPANTKAVTGARDGSLEGVALAQVLETYAKDARKRGGKNAEARARAAEDFIERIMSGVRPDDVTAAEQRDAVADDAGAAGAGVSDTGDGVGSPGGQAAPGAGTPAGPDGGTLGDAGGDTSGTDGRAGGQPDALSDQARVDDTGAAPDTPEAKQALRSFPEVRSDRVRLLPVKFPSLWLEPDPDNPGKNRKRRGTGVSQLVNIGGRVTALVDVNGVKVPFYISTGSGGKKNVPTGKWYPFFGYDLESGNTPWLNKGSEAQIVDYYGSPELRAAAEALDAEFGDLQNDARVPKTTVEVAEAFNADMNPVANGDREGFARNLNDVLARIRAGRKSQSDTSVSPAALPGAPSSEMQAREGELPPGYDQLGTQGIPPEQTPGAPAAESDMVPVTDAELENMGLGPRTRLRSGVRKGTLQGAELLAEVQKQAGNRKLSAPAREDLAALAAELDRALSRESPDPAIRARQAAQAQAELKSLVERTAGPEVAMALREIEWVGGANAERDTVTTVPDRRAVLDLLRTPAKRDERSVSKSPAAAARRYFGTNYRMDTVLDEIAHDIVAANVYGEKLRSTKTDPEADGPDSGVPRIDAYLLRKGGPAAVQAADWVEANLSPQAQEFLATQIVMYEDRAARQARTARIEAGKEARQQRIAEARKAMRAAEVEAGLFDPVVDDTRSDFDEVVAAVAEVGLARTQVATGAVSPTRADAFMDLLREQGGLSGPAPAGRAKQERSRTSGIDSGAATRMRVAGRAQSSSRKPTLKAPPPGLDINFLERRAPSASLAGALHPMVLNQLQAGNLRGALQTMARTYPGRAGRVAAALARVLPDVPVSVLSDANMDIAMRLATVGRARPPRTPSGMYLPPATEAQLDATYADPEARELGARLRGSILLNIETLTPHVLLHEAVHALSYSVLSNPSHPLTRRLETLRTTLGDALAGEYGATEVGEFLSEAMSNPEFQQKLARINVDGTRTTALQTFRRAVVNFLRRLIGLDPKQGTAQDVADGVFFALLDNPDPMYRGAGDLSEISFLPRSDRRDASPKPASKMVKFTRESAKRVEQMMGDLSVPVPLLEGVIRGLVPLRNLVDMAQGSIPNAENIYKLLEEHGAVVSNSTNEARVAIARINRFLKDNPDKLDTFNDMRLSATLLNMDPSKPANYYKDNRYRVFYDVTDSNGNFVRREVKGYKTEKARATALGKLNTDIPAGRSKAKQMKVITDAELKEFGDLRQMYQALGPDGQRAYADALGVFKHFHKVAGESLREGFRAMFPNDPSKGTSIYNDIYHKILANPDDTMHQPLQRRGDFWVSYRIFEGANDTEGTLRKESFVTAQERREALDALDQINAEGEYRVDDVTPYEVDKNGRRSAEVPLSFVNEVLSTIDGAGQLTDTLRQQIVDLAFDAAPERSFIQTWRRRKGTEGFLGGKNALDRKLTRQDTVELLQQKAFSTARQLADMRYSRQLQAEMEEARNTVAARARPEGGGTSLERERRSRRDQMFLRLLGDYSKAVRTQRSGWSRTITAGTYGMTLGFNLSTAALTFMQVPTIIIPHLGAKYGMGALTGAMGRAMRTLSATGGSRQEASIQPDGTVAAETVDTARADLSLLNIDFDADQYRDPKWQRLRPLAEEMRRRGMDGRTIVSEVLGTDDDPNVNWFQKIVALSGAMQRHSERFVRETTALAAYEMELKKRANGRKISDLTAEELADAADAAIYETELTNGTIMAAGAPLWAQGNIGSIIYLYKRFGLHMLNLLGRQLYRSLGRNPNPEDKRIARLQLASTLGAVALFSGVQGLPFFHALAAAYDLLLQDDDEEDFETVVRTGLMGELGYNGVVNYVTNANVASRIGLSGMLYREPFNADSKPWLYAQLQAIGGPAVGLTMDAVDRGIPLLADGEIYRGAEALLPSAIANPMRSLRFYTEGTNTLRGDPITGDISFASAAGQFFGFAPADYIRQLEQNAQLKRINDAISTERTRLLKQRYVAYRTGDGDGYRDAMQKIREFNRENPQNPITRETLESSLNSHRDSSTRMHHGVLFDRKNEAMLRAMARDWGPVTLYE